MLHALVDSGNSVIVIEHNLEVIKTADWVVDIGPEGGDGGGYVVGVGTPEEVATVKESYTGRYLAEILARRGSKLAAPKKPAKPKAKTATPRRRKSAA